MRASGWLSVVVSVCACGPAGSISGTVTVEGGSGANVPVAVYGAVSQVVLTGEDGRFTATNLPDGQYLTRAIIKGAEVEEVSAPVKVSGGKGDSEPTLAFKLKAAVVPGKITGRVVAMGGGSAANVTVFVHGPQSSVAVTATDGSFTTAELPDGAYVLRATMKGALVEEVTAQAKLTSGQLDAEPVLTFRFPETTTVTGKVVFSDGSDASGLVVTLTSATWMATRTQAMGAFSFSNVPSGAGVLSVEATNTREGRVSLGIEITGALVDAGELRLTPTARVGGTVTSTGMPVSGAIVTVAGTGLSATTNASGRFDFEGAPVGDVTIVARTTTPSQVGSAMQRLSRGPNGDVTVAITSDAKTGTVAGAVTFAGTWSPRTITVSIPALGLSTQPGMNGAYTLANVPVGDWDVYATAPQHPRQLLGHVAVNDQTTSTLAGEVLSFFEPVWESNANIVGAGLIAAQGPWSVISVSESGANRSLLVNSRTRDTRVLTNGVVIVTLPRFSPNARYLGFIFTNLLHVYDVTTGQLRIWTNDTGLTGFAFSTDETVLFVTRTASLERYDLSSGMMTRFPTVGTASIATHTNDRYFVIESSTASLVEPAMVTPNVFTQLTTMGTSPTPFGLTNCTAVAPVTCTLRIVAPTARTANAVSGSWPVGTSLGGLADFSLLYHAATSTQYVVRSSDANLFPLPNGSVNIAFSPGGQRIGYLVLSPPGSSLREEALPPSPTTTAIATNPSGLFDHRWLSPTRLVASELTAPRRIIDVRNGTPSFDTDVTGAWSTAGLPAVAWPAGSTMTSKAFVGDRVMPFDTGLPIGSGLAGVLARPGTPVTEVGLANFDANSVIVLDGRANQVRRIVGLRTGVSGWQRIGTIELFPVQHSGINALLLVDTSGDQLIEHVESRMLLSAPIESNGAYFNVDETRRRLVMGVIR